VATTYAVLPRASANRVYGEAAFGLAGAELQMLDRGLPEPRVQDIERATLGGVDYLLVHCLGDGFSADDLAVVSNLSSLHALFELEDDGLLRPVTISPLRRHDDDLTTIQRYPGKTNEAFTHLLVNLALAATTRGFERLVAGERLRLLDPACGRGTTLNRGVVYGFDTIGVELDGRDVEAFEAFFLGWCKDKRLKHKVERARLRKGRPTPATRCTVTFGASKDVAEHRVLEVLNDDTVQLRSHLKARSVDLLVCDLPYGVQHGSTPAAGALQRSPAQLLDDALPAWFDVLVPGAGVALAWNLRTLPRTVLVAALEAHGLELVVPVDDPRFAHRVDRSILRDVVVARRPG
jgi:hypothetical protein